MCCIGQRRSSEDHRRQTVGGTVGRKQPNWAFTPKRRASLKKARKKVTKMRKKAGVAVITKGNLRKVRKQGGSAEAL
jgi:hypothetical protein